MKLSPCHFNEKNDYKITEPKYILELYQLDTSYVDVDCPFPDVINKTNIVFYANNYNELLLQAINNVNRIVNENSIYHNNNSVHFRVIKKEPLVDTDSNDYYKVLDLFNGILKPFECDSICDYLRAYYED